ncbi:MAG: hypothetical protein RR645_04750 [Clostridium sp.]
MALSEDMEYIVPFEKVNKKLSPNIEYDIKILNYLYYQKIIRVHPKSDVKAFSSDNFPENFNMFKVKYVVNIDFNDSYQEIIASLMNISSLESSNKEEAIEIWREISLEECLSYLEQQMTGVRFNFNCGEKTIAVINDMLNHFSASQIYGIIYRGVANATKYYQENNINKIHVANMVIGSCQRYAERAILKKWNLVNFRRHEPESVLSELFFHRVLQIGELGFTMPPIEL